VDIVEFKEGEVESANALWVELPCQPQHNLDWSSELRKAKESGKKIVWYFNLGLEDPFFPLEDELRFSSISLALQQFTKDVWPHVQEQTLAMSLYKGAIVEFAMYFQMLAHKLPDEAPIWLLFDIPQSMSIHKAFQSIFLDGFEHFEIALKGKELPRDGYRWDREQIAYHYTNATTGLVFPSDPTAPFDHLIATEPSPESVRVVLEAYLAEQWEGLDRLKVLSNHVTPQGKRMLQGFMAAGGEIISI
jgi:hypothetical protein